MQEQPALPGQSAAAYIEKKWGGPTRLLPVKLVTVTAVGNAPTQIYENNPRRMEVTVVNTGVANAYVGWDQNLDATHGILVSPLGGSVIFLVDEDGELVTYPLFGVGGVVMAYWEIIRK